MSGTNELNEANNIAEADMTGLAEQSDENSDKKAYISPQKNKIH